MTNSKTTKWSFIGCFMVAKKAQNGLYSYSKFVRDFIYFLGRLKSTVRSTFCRLRTLRERTSLSTRKTSSSLLPAGRAAISPPSSDATKNTPAPWLSRPGFRRDWRNPRAVREVFFLRGPPDPRRSDVLLRPFPTFRSLLAQLISFREKRCLENVLYAII